MGERTGSRVFSCLWSYVEEEDVECVVIVASRPERWVSVSLRGHSWRGRCLRGTYNATILGTMYVYPIPSNNSAAKPMVFPFQHELASICALYAHCSRPLPILIIDISLCPSK